MLIACWHLFIAFFKASNLSFGGGAAMIPLIQAEVVDNYHWMTNAQFADMIAVANALPGPIATKIAAYMGYQIASWPGVITAMTATILPTVLILIMLGKVLAKYSQSETLRAALKGVRPVVAALLLYVAYSMGIEAFLITQTMDYVTFIIAIGAALALYFFKVHPVLLIILSMAIGYIIF
ncbi:chromate transporter [Dehalobacter sp. DCM]|uniref:chromate transporter n=1 Tax=Dehalobacter sp. DCM TaxID=2907827 RepID=UPI003081A1C2|nr:chromate transporter [Dehalobacter sp. DCM]